MKPVGKPDALIGHVRFDERGWETGRRSTSVLAPILDSTISTGWALLRQPNDVAGEQDDPLEGKEVECSRQSFYPLTLPLTVGPGAISVAVTVGASRPERSEWYWPLIVGMILGSALVSASIYLSYRFAQRIERTIGIAAMDVIIRISSFILVCIGVQILWNGLSTLLRAVIS